VAAGVEKGERCVVAVFEEHPESYEARAVGLGIDLAGMVERGDLEIMYLRPLDLSVDDTLQGIRERVERLGAKRVVIDSLSGFEIALAPSFRQDFRESFYRLVQALTAMNVTVFSTMESTESTDSLRFSSFNVSFRSDDIISMRYVELEG
jgi:circadian clock protein KaiC